MDTLYERTGIVCNKYFKVIREKLGENNFKKGKRKMNKKIVVFLFLLVITSSKLACEDEFDAMSDAISNGPLNTGFFKNSYKSSTQASKLSSSL